MRRLTILLSSVILASASVSGATTDSIYAWRTLKGHPGGTGNADGPAATARFWFPDGIAADNAGNLYVADTYNHTIRKISSAGLVTTLAGSPGQFGSADGLGNAARFASPGGVAVDNAGNVYMADTDNSTIRKVTSSGLVSTLAGAPGQTGTADGTGGAARFAYPTGIAVDNAGNVYVADSANSTIRKVTSGGAVTTLAGTPGQFGSADGTGSAAQFWYPSGVARDSAGNLFVADLGNHTIRKITTTLEVTTLAGSVGDPGSNDGTNAQAQFSYPSGVAVDGAGNIYVADSDNSIIRKITSDGVATTLAGSPQSTGSDDGVGSAASFFYPSGIAADSAGNLYVADTDNSIIRNVTTNGVVTTLAGSVDRGGSTDASADMARFKNPCGVTADGLGNVYVADTYNDTLRKITFGGLVSTLAGQPGQPGSADGTNQTARFKAPYSVTADNAGNLYVADTFNNTIRTVTADGTVTTLAGSPGQAGSTNGTGSDARFSGPIGLAADNAGNLYVADYYSNILRKVTSAGVVTTLAGSPGQAGSTNGTGSAARFSGPYGVATDSAGNIYVSDSANHTIRRVTSDGTVSTLAGSPGQFGSTDGTGDAARFFSPAGLAFDGAGNLYVADLANHSIRKVIVASGVVTTLAGDPGHPGSADGTGSAARFYYPLGLAMDAAGILLVADFQNDTIRKVTAGGVVTTWAGSPGEIGSDDVDAEAVQFYQPGGVAVDTAGSVFVADTYNNTIRKVTTDGAVRTLAGVPGQSGSNDGKGNNRFWQPLGLGVDNAGNLYVADSHNNTIRKIDPDGEVTTLAGNATQAGTADGPGSLARFSYPSGLTLDSAGSIFVTDAFNSTIRRITVAGVVTTLAGSPGQSGSADGVRSAARFSRPNGLAADSVGNLYVADSGNSTLRKVTAAGVVTTLAGSPGQSGSADGMGSAARFDYPFGVAVDGAGNVYVADSGNSTIRRVTSAGEVTTIGGMAGILGGADGVGISATFASPAGVAVDSSGRLYIADSGNNRISRGLLLPTLNIAGSSASLTVSWASPSTGFVLQQNSTLNNPDGWSASAYAINDDGTNKSVTVAFPAGNQFFRLSAD